MTYEEIMSTLADMKNRFDAGFSSTDRTFIEKQYKEILNKRITNLSCGNCYRDAFVEIYAHLKKAGKLEIRNYRLKSGHYLHKFSSSEFFFNPISDEIAERCLKENPNLISEFSQYPEDWRKRAGIDAESHEDDAPAQVTAESENAPQSESKPRRKYRKRTKAE